ncbi:hypothetical protein SHDE107825_10395 [Shewanella denitrificans]
MSQVLLKFGLKRRFGKLFNQGAKNTVFACEVFTRLKIFKGLFKVKRLSHVSFLFLYSLLK